MTSDVLTRLFLQLERHEGVALKPYTDTVGKVTIGVGRNLTDMGITEEESDALLVHDIERVTQELNAAFPWFVDLDMVRQAALVNIGFMGLTRLRTFRKALKAMAHEDYERASREFADSKWARQVGQRAVELCAQIRTGTWQT